MSVFALEFQKQRDHRNLFYFAMRLCLEFKALCGSIFHHHPLLSLTESVAEFTFEEIRLRILSSSLVPVQSVSLPTVLTTPSHPSTSRGPLNHGPPSCGPVNLGQQTRGSSTQA